MSNIETAKKGYELFQRGDVATLIKDVIDDNCHWISPGKDKLPWAGSFKGKTRDREFLHAAKSTLGVHRIRPA
jgi:ketosteroid isomerase-like protein